MIIPPSFEVRVGRGYKSSCVTTLVFGITVKICTVRYSNKKTNCIRLLLDKIHTLLRCDNAARLVYLNGIHMYIPVHLIYPTCNFEVFKKIFITHFIWLPVTLSSVFGWTSIYTVLHALPNNFGPHCSIFTYFRLKYKPPSVRKGLIPGTTVEEIAYTRKKRLFDVAS